MIPLTKSVSLFKRLSEGGICGIENKLQGLIVQKEALVCILNELVEGKDLLLSITLNPVRVPKQKIQGK